MTARPSLAQDFFETIINQSDPAAYLRSFVNSSPPMFEEEWLDFKGCRDGRTGRELAPKKVAETWSENIAAFANTAGGVLVWGIVADKHERGGRKVDAAHDFSLTDDVDAFASLLRENLHQAVDPPVRNTEIVPIPDGNAQGGFVVCFVPESDFKPHRAERAGRQWFVRAGDSNIVPNPALLRSLFYPQTRSLIHIEASPDTRRNSANDITLAQVYITLRNDGPSTARELFAQIKARISNANNVEDHPRMLHSDTPWSRSELCTRLESFFPPTYECSDILSARMPVHPGDRITVVHFHWNDLHREHTGVAGIGPAQLRVAIKLFAADREPQLFRATIGSRELRNRASVPFVLDRENVEDFEADIS